MIIFRGFSRPEEITFNVFSDSDPVNTAKQLSRTLTKKSEKSRILDILFYGLHVCPEIDSSNISEAIKRMEKQVEELDNENVPWNSHCIHPNVNLFLSSLDNQDKINQLKAAQQFLANANASLITHLSPMVNTHSDEFPNSDTEKRYWSVEKVLV